MQAACRATETWKLLRPDGRPPSIWLAARVVRLGAGSLAQALQKVSQALRLQGKIPASARGKEAVVRLELCPAPKAAAHVERHTAWCRSSEATCPHLEKVGDGWIECAELKRQLAKHREGVRIPQDEYSWDVKHDTKVDKPSGLKGLLTVLGPTVLTGLLVWKLKDREIDRIKKQVTRSPNDQHALIKSVLDARRMTYSYDTSKKVFILPGASITLLPGGGAEFRDRRGKKTKATKSNLLSVLFDFVERI